MGTESAIVPTRRRRYSGSIDNSDHFRDLLRNSGSTANPSTVVPPPRPKSASDERPYQRLRRRSPSPTTDKAEMTQPTIPQNTHTPVPDASNPAMLPVQAHVHRGGIAASNRRLYVILEQACLETYRISGGGSSGKGRNRKGDGEVKYTLLNCDDHQGILAKTGRDIADARPDITHQVGLVLEDAILVRSHRLQRFTVLVDTVGLAP